MSVGAYTKPDVVRSFFKLFKADRINLEGDENKKFYPILWEEIVTDSVWRGETRVSGVGDGGLGERKGSCRLWIGRWANV